MKGYRSDLRVLDGDAGRKEVYGHLGRRKRHLMGRLEGINKRMTIDGMDHALQRLQRNLWVELEEIILQEDLMWLRKLDVIGFL